jgi:hypothetical protein
MVLREILILVSIGVVVGVPVTLAGDRLVWQHAVQTQSNQPGHARQRDRDIADCRSDRRLLAGAKGFSGRPDGGVAV